MPTGVLTTRKWGRRACWPTVANDEDDEDDGDDDDEDNGCHAGLVRVGALTHERVMSRARAVVPGARRVTTLCQEAENSAR